MDKKIYFVRRMPGEHVDMITEDKHLADEYCKYHNNRINGEGKSFSTFGYSYNDEENHRRFHAIERNMHNGFIFTFKPRNLGYNDYKLTEDLDKVEYGLTCYGDAPRINNSNAIFKNYNNIVIQCYIPSEDGNYPDAVVDLRSFMESHNITLDIRENVDEENLIDFKIPESNDDLPKERINASDNDSQKVIKNDNIFIITRANGKIIDYITKDKDIAEEYCKFQNEAITTDEVDHPFQYIEMGVWLSQEKLVELKSQNRYGFKFVFPDNESRIYNLNNMKSVKFGLWSKSFYYTYMEVKPNQKDEKFKIFYVPSKNGSYPQAIKDLKFFMADKNMKLVH